MSNNYNKLEFDYNNEKIQTKTTIGSNDAIKRFDGCKCYIKCSEAQKLQNYLNISLEYVNLFSFSNGDVSTPKLEEITKKYGINANLYSAVKNTNILNLVEFNDKINVEIRDFFTRKILKGYIWNINIFKKTFNIMITTNIFKKDVYNKKRFPIKFANLCIINDNENEKKQYGDCNINIQNIVTDGQKTEIDGQKKETYDKNTGADSQITDGLNTVAGSQITDGLNTGAESQNTGAESQNTDVYESLLSNLPESGTYTPKYKYINDVKINQFHIPFDYVNVSDIWIKNDIPIIKFILINNINNYSYLIKIFKEYNYNITNFYEEDDLDVKASSFKKILLTLNIINKIIVKVGNKYPNIKLTNENTFTKLNTNYWWIIYILGTYKNVNVINFIADDNNTMKHINNISSVLKSNKTLVESMLEELIKFLDTLSAEEIKEILS